jgi:hypothetical protein
MWCTPLPAQVSATSFNKEISVIKEVYGRATSKKHQYHFDEVRELDAVHFLSLLLSTDCGIAAKCNPNDYMCLDLGVYQLHHSRRNLQDHAGAHGNCPCFILGGPFFPLALRLLSSNSLSQLSVPLPPLLLSLLLSLVNIWPVFLT